MKIARVRITHEGQPVLSYALVERLGPNNLPTADTVLHQIKGFPFGEIQPTGARLSIDDIDAFAAPVLPSKIICVAQNYRAHAEEMGKEVPAEPMVFLKPSTSVIGPEESIVLPPQSEQVEHEAELAIVIGKFAKDVSPEQVNDAILGYTCANDVTARDLQRKDGQWGRAKGFDTFCPLGPWIETDLDAGQVAISCEVAGELRQSGSTADMVHTVADLVSWVSSVMTLLPGDVILTGTPSGVGALVDGDDVTVSIEGIGSLTNLVRKG